MAHDEKYIRDISVLVYRVRMGEKDADDMVAEDNDGGKKFRNRAGAYDALSRAYLDVLGAEINQLRAAIE